MVGVPLHPLDNPVWEALNGPQAHLAVQRGPLKFYPPDVAPFAAFAERSDAALVPALAEVARSVVLFRPQLEPAPAGWITAYQSSMVQLFCPGESSLTETGLAETGLRGSGAAVVRLGSSDVPDMLNLIKLTRPGPFKPRTPELGAYDGVRVGGQLVALAGERLRLSGFTEISAVCTHPDWRGHGLARLLVGQVARRALSQGQTPFLHVMPANAGALRVYGSLGFVQRARIHLSVWAPLPLD